MLQKKEINAGVEEYRSLEHAKLVDVRNDFEYKGGHIPGSENLALSLIVKEVEDVYPDKAAPMYLYCQSGARSSRAAKLLDLMGYETVVDLGGIADYTGPKEQ